MKSFAAFAALTFIKIVIAANVETVNHEIVVDSIERSINLESQLVKISSKVTLTNNGKGATKGFHYAVEESMAPHVAYIGATVGSSEKTYLRVNEVQVKDSPAGATLYRVELKKALSSSESVTVSVDLVLGKALELYPAEIVQREKQLVLLRGNHYAYLPYKCKTQTTTIQLPSNTVENYSKLKPVSQTENKITYGPYSNQEPYALDEMTVHYENNHPFLVVTKMERVVELSMWGNIAIEETIDVRHNGAALKGSFSRYEFQRENSGIAAVKNFKTFLPASARDVYYRDDIGNISTSAMKVKDDYVELDLRPRFPLFGGWKTHYVLGYNVPSYEYLYNTGDDFVLSMRLIDHVFDDMLVEEFTLKIILPEGSDVGKFHAPYPTKRLKDGLHFTYLDYSGRPVITVESKGELTEKHIMDFQLEFKFSKLKMMCEPLMLIIAFFIFFMFAFIYVRLDFSISKDEGQEVRLKVAGFCEKISGLQERRWANYEKFDEALRNLKASKDVNAFKTDAKTIANDQKNESQAIVELTNNLKTISPETADKVQEMHKLDGILREYQNSQAILAEKLVGGKLGKQQFVEQEAIIIKRKDECKERIIAINSHLV